MTLFCSSSRVVIAFGRLLISFLFALSTRSTSLSGTQIDDEKSLKDDKNWVF